MIVGSIRNVLRTEESNLYSAAILVMGSFVLLLMWYYLRSFSLKAQDRAIRAEERLRYFVLTGKTMSSALSMRQIIGLRFASDEEFVALCEKAEKEKLSETDIKKAIKTWKPDTDRV